MEKKLEIALAGDCDIVRAGLEAILEREAGISVTGHYRTVQALLNAGLRTTSVVLVDWNMPGLSIARLTWLRRQFPDSRFIAFSTLPGRFQTSSLLTSGVAAYLDRSASASEITSAVLAAHKDQPAESPNTRQNPKADHATARLSSREFEILLLLAGGKKPTEIATMLNVRVGTITTHVHRIKKKLGLRSLGDLVLYGYKNHLVPG